MPFRSLDFVYTPSSDVARDLAHFTGALGGEAVFAIEAFDTRVAMVRLSDEGPGVLLAGHLEGETPVLVYRVDDIASAGEELRGRGWKEGHSLEIPQGPVRSFTAPGGQRLAIYELTRPGVEASFEGRREF